MKKKILLGVLGVNENVFHEKYFLENIFRKINDLLIFFLMFG